MERGKYEVYAAIRRYRIDPDQCPEAVNQALEAFVPVIKGSQGLLAYYVVAGEDGVIASITIGEDKERVEASSRAATEWAKQSIASSIVSTEKLHSLFVEVEEPLHGPLYEGFSEMCPNGSRTRLLSVQEVCEALGMGKSWVYKHIRSGELPSIRMGGSIKVEHTDLEEYLYKRRRAARE